jgi:tetratricopeptide (TPR) repeat protein
MRQLVTIPVAAVVIATLTASSCFGPQTDREAPRTPTGIAVRVDDGTVILTWQVVTADDLAGYYVYYREHPGGTEQQSALLTETRFTVTGLVNGTEYLFAVTAVDESGNESERSPEVSAIPNDEVSLTAEGWIAWEAGDYETAGSNFQLALSHDPRYSEAHTGLGWTALKEHELQTAADCFDEAIQNGPANEDPRVGGLIVHRELPGGLWIARSYGYTALQNDPDYEFSHDPAIDADLVRLMLAQVNYLTGAVSFAAAQALLDILVPGNGLDPASSASWIVDGTTYTTYAAALLALIEYAFTLHWG